MISNNFSFILDANLAVFTMPRILFCCSIYSLHTLWSFHCTQCFLFCSHSAFLTKMHLLYPAWGTCSIFYLRKHLQSSWFECALFTSAHFASSPPSLAHCCLYNSVPPQTAFCSLQKCRLHKRLLTVSRQTNTLNAESFSSSIAVLNPYWSKNSTGYLQAIIYSRLHAVLGLK